MIKRLAHAFFAWYCHPDYYPDIAGDLEELYHRTQQHRPRWAPWRYLFQVLGLFRPSLMKEFGQNSILNRSMIRNYFKVSRRYFAKHRMFTTIHVVGLALGLAAFLLMRAYIQFERSYDTFHADADQLYRLSVHFIGEGGTEVKDAMMYHPAVKALVEEVPEIQAASAVRPLNEVAFRQHGEAVYEKGGLWADSTFLQLFDYPVIYGERSQMLNEPYQVVLTESKARVYFGEGNPVGKTMELLWWGIPPLTVTGVIADVPENTHLKFDMLISNPTFSFRYDFEKWNYNNHYVFVKLGPGANANQLPSKLEAIQRKYQYPDEDEGETLDEYWKANAVAGIHLTSDYTYEPEAPGNLRSLQVLEIIALFILIVAWVNYINLTTARAVDRAKEVGLRKVVGATRGQLITQFFVDALLINALATLFALAIAELVLPAYHTLIGLHLAPHVWEYPNFLRQLGGLFLLGTFITGAYPSLVLSQYTPATILKGKFRHSRQGLWLRKGLVTLQFTTSLVLISGTLLVYQQMQFIRQQNLGLDADYVVGLRRDNFPNDEQREASEQRFISFRDRLRTHSAIESVGGISQLPGVAQAGISSTTNPVGLVGQEPIAATTYIQQIDDHLLETLDIAVKEGRGYDFERFADTMGVVVNEAFARQFNLANPTDLVGEHVSFGFGGEDDPGYEIVGVVQDIHRTSLKNQVEPTIYLPNPTPLFLVVELQPQAFRDGLAHLEAVWQEVYPDAPLEMHFLDQEFDALYRADRRFGKVVGVFAGLAIFIASLGLLGLAALMAVQRTKEVGVRKVLGASIPQIMGLFFRDFLVLIGLAAVVGLPIYYLALNAWLQNFATRIDFPWHLLVLALGVVAAFVMIIVGLQTWRVARQKPSATLRYE